MKRQQNNPFLWVILAIYLAAKPLFRSLMKFNAGPHPNRLMRERKSRELDCFQHAAIDEIGRTDAIARPVGAEEDEEICELLRRAETLG